MMGIHSKNLVHWTGKKDIDDCSVDEKEKTQRYVKRLRDHLEKGLYTKKTSEDVVPGWKIKKLVRVCFTEIRLSQAQKHAEEYGKLGIGFTRDFIMNKGGRPVIYIPHKASDDSRLLEDSIRYVYENSKNDIHRSSKWIMAHVKRMSNGKKEDSKDYKDYYEEMEWRLVYDERSTHFKKGEVRDVYWLPFEVSDVKVIIFPDKETKQLSLRDNFIRDYFSKHLPIMATLEDCHNF